MTEITIGEHELMLGHMPPRKQFHVARRLAPLMSSFIEQLDLAKLKEAPAPSDEKPGDTEIPTPKPTILDSLKIGPIMDALSDMKDEDCDYVLDACLSVVKVKQGSGYSPLMRNGQMMFQSITLLQMLQITAEVVMQDLSGFMPGVGSTSAAPAAG